MTFLKEILSTSATRAFLSIVMGFLVGAIFMMVSGEEVGEALESGGLGDALAAALMTVADGYSALFRGSIFNTRAEDLVTALRPLTETLRLGAPLIAAGLGISLGFRVGLFNIGGNGQMVFGILWATWISTRMELPIILHMLVALVVAILGASLWGALVGFLKAQTGAHEVILTIMLNYVSIYLFTWFIRNPNLLQQVEAGGTPKSDAPAVTAQLPQLFPGTYSLHLGFCVGHPRRPDVLVVDGTFCDRISIPYGGPQSPCCEDCRNFGGENLHLRDGRFRRLLGCSGSQSSIRYSSPLYGDGSRRYWL